MLLQKHSTSICIKTKPSVRSASWTNSRKYGQRRTSSISLVRVTELDPEQELEFQLHRTVEIKVGKVGLKVNISEEMISDSQWDVNLTDSIPAQRCA